MLYLGMNIIESYKYTKVKQIPKRKNKSKRIQKKWIKKYGMINIYIPDPNIYLCHPSVDKVYNNIISNYILSNQGTFKL